MHVIDLLCIFVSAKEIEKDIITHKDMTQNRKYEVGCSGSGWGVWDAEGNKVATFSGRSIGRYEALRHLYHLNNWDWNKSKYVRAEPWLKDFKVVES